jgi:hypothetical protein
MQQCLSEDTVLAFLDGRLSPEAIAVLEEHVGQCQACDDWVVGAARALTHDTLLDVRATGSASISDISNGIPSVVDGYRIIGLIGYGGMGIVYRATHEVSGERVALKTVRVQTHGALASIRREIHALSRVRHPGVVRILHQGIDRGRPWYAMDLIEGKTLEELLRMPHPRQDGPRHEATSAPALPEMLEIICRLCDTLSFLHGRGVVHRDVTPRNVVVRSDGAPILVDFGLATRNERSGRDVLEYAAFMGGTLTYMAPEQIRGELLDPRADLYAVGCILYEIVTGRPPFESTSGIELARQHLSLVPALPSTFVKGLDPALEALIMRLLQKRRRDRIGYAEDVAAALAPFTGKKVFAVSGARSRSYVYRPEFSGRTELLGTFDDLLLGMDEGRGARIFVSGESGVGKTRFVAEVASRARACDFRVITGECLALSVNPTRETELSTALHPLRPVLRALIDTCGDERERAERLVGARGKLLAAYEPDLLDLPGQDEHPDPSPLTAQAAHYRLLDALRETLAALASESPLVLVLDDLQWADELSLDLLETFPTDFFERHRILLIGTYRSEEVSSHIERAVGAAGARTVTLGRFDSPVIERMVGDMLALNEVPAPLLERLSSVSDGNAFFVAEYLRVGVGEGWIVRELGATWRLEVSDERTPLLPQSLSELLERRLAPLSAPARHLIEVASVLGRESGGDFLIATSGLAEAEGMNVLEELVSHALLDEMAGDQLRFAHDKVREVAYEGVPVDRRRELHRCAAIAIEKKRFNAAARPSLDPILAHHWGRAGILSKAIEHLEKAGDQALKRAAYAEAAGFFLRAIGRTR